MSRSQVLLEERRTMIQDLLAQQPAVVISKLAERFGTSEMTIRRDLDELEARGVCQRIHGGAMSLRVLQHQNVPYPPFPARRMSQVREKAAIGRLAATMVQPGEIIAIDSGTTAANLAYALRDRGPLTVVTNSMRVMEQIYDVTSITLISCGGTLSVETMTAGGGDLSFVGPIGVATLGGFRPSKAFVSTTGITVTDGISDASLFQVEVKRTLMEISAEVILIADHTKFGRVAGFIVAEAGSIHKIVTDTAAPQDDVEALRALGIEVILVESASAPLPLRSPIWPGAEPATSNAVTLSMAGRRQTDRGK